MTQFSKPIRDYLHVYFDSTNLNGLLQVDLTLALLRGGYTEEAERVSGVPIQYGRSALKPTPAACYTTQDQPRVHSKTLPTSPRVSPYLIQRLNRTRVGMTIPQLLARGWTEHTIRHARQAGYLEIK